MFFMTLAAHQRQPFSNFSNDNISSAEKRIFFSQLRFWYVQNQTDLLNQSITYTYMKLIKLMNFLPFCLEQQNEIVDGDMKQLLISFGKPHNPVFSDMIIRRIT